MKNFLEDPRYLNLHWIHDFTKDLREYIQKAFCQSNQKGCSLMGPNRTSLDCAKQYLLSWQRASGDKDFVPGPMVILAGPTASGKSALALHLAKKLGAEILNADSAQVYRGAPILTASPGSEDQSIVKHHLYGIADPAKDFITVAQWLQELRLRCQAIWSAGKCPIVVGGTGFYISALLNDTLSSISNILPEDQIKWIQKANALNFEVLCQEVAFLDPDWIKKPFPKDPQRMKRAWIVAKATGKPLTYWWEKAKALQDSREICPYQAARCFPVVASLSPSLAWLWRRANERWNAMKKEGVFQEVESCLKTLPKIHRLKQSLGFSQIEAFLNHQITEFQCDEEYLRQTRSYIKRQRTWLKNKMHSTLSLI